MDVGQIASVLGTAELAHQVERITQQSAEIVQQIRQRYGPAFIFGQMDASIYLANFAWL